MHIGHDQVSSCGMLEVRRTLKLHVLLEGHNARSKQALLQL
jgi:hypothetical protein